MIPPYQFVSFPVPSTTFSPASSKNSNASKIDHRFERNYTDRGFRQQAAPFRRVRSIMDEHMSGTRYRSSSPLFIPDTSIPESDRELSPSSLFSDRDPSDSPSPEAEAVSNEDSHCTCPISYNCAHRAPDEVDNRPLVAQYVEIARSIDKESFERRKTYLANPKNTTASNSKLRKVVDLIRRVETIPLDDKNSRMMALQALSAWTDSVQACNVAQESLDATEILPIISTFLSDERKDTRRRVLIPSCIEENLTVLYRKLAKGDLDCDPNRGLTQKNHNFSVDKTYAHRVSACQFGQLDFVNGQMWTGRAQMMRDGMHAAPVAGICGTIRDGAYSVVMGLHTTEHKYADVDNHYTVEYMGTSRDVPADAKGKGRQQDLEPTSGTRTLFRSLETGVPVRLIRSHKLAPMDRNRPAVGYRFDGMYTVTSKQLVDATKQEWSFTMTRVPGQGKLHGINPNDPAIDASGSRPTATASTSARADRPGKKVVKAKGRIRKKSPFVKRRPAARRGLSITGRGLSF